RASGADDARAVTLAAVVELIHLATLVHDDSVDHSVLRRGMPTINALFSHQVAVIMGDYLYSRAIIELVRLDDLAPLRVFARVTNEMTVGEMRQLEAHDKLAYDEAQYDQLIRSKTASLAAARPAGRSIARDTAGLTRARRLARQHCLCRGTAQLRPWRAGTAARYFTWGSSPAGSCSAGCCTRCSGAFCRRARLRSFSLRP